MVYPKNLCEKKNREEQTNEMLCGPNVWKKTNEKGSKIFFFHCVFIASAIRWSSTQQRNRKWHFCDCILTTWNPLVSPRKWLWFFFFIFILQSFTHPIVRSLTRRVNSFVGSLSFPFRFLFREQCQKMYKLCMDALYGKLVCRFIYLGALSGRVHVSHILLRITHI